MQKTLGIVLRTTKYSETSVIAKIYTKHFGLISVIQNGVRTSNLKRNKSSLFQPMSILQVDMDYRKDKNLQRMKEFRRSKLLESVLSDVIRSSLGIFMIELILKTIREEGESNEDLFDFLLASFVNLDECKKEKLSSFHLHFMLDMSYYFGFYPSGSFYENGHFFDLKEGSFTALPPKHSQFLNEVESECLFAMMKDDKQPLPIAPKTLLNPMISYYQYHIGGFGEMRSPEVLRVILE